MALNFLRRQQSTDEPQPLGGRYHVLSRLGGGGFGQTFLAEDLHLPGHPRCVVKQLKPQVSDSASLQTARRLFDTEAQVLYQLGSHDQIPRLLAHFEQSQEFYLAQELVEGRLLSQELQSNQPWSEAQVVALLQDLLTVLAFVHQQNVIHRDIKPANLIRRQRDRRIVLIDFGAVKQVSTQLADTRTHQTNLTISIGTQGYMPNEQLGGNPRFSSDLYAVGKVAIQALTGVHPRHLQEDPQTGEVVWRDRAPDTTPELADFLDRLIRYDFRARYATAVEALEALEALPEELREASTTVVWPSVPAQAIPGLEGPLATEGTTVDAGSVGSTLVPEAGLAGSWTPQKSSQTGPTVPMMVTGSSQSASRGTPLALQPITWVAAALLLGATAWGAWSLLGDRPQSLEASVQASQSPEASPPETAASPAPTASPTPSSAPSPSPSASPSPAAATASPTGASPAPAAQPATPAGTPANSGPQAAQVLASAQKLQEAERYPEALSAFDQAIALQEGSAEAHQGRCFALNKLGRFDEALSACNRAIALNSNYPEAHWSRGFALDATGRHGEALAAYDQAIALNPNYSEAWSNRGAALLMLKRDAEALAAFDRATELNPQLAEAWNNRGATLWNLGRYEEALASVNRALEIRPDYSDARSLQQQMRARIGG
ncbi:protein kinase domain-containing protein [Geitlerinema sp. PCC 7407]|uniref:serine/threonine-protein kinase n=1 Tax=Geitlerinema sp. PCC 7407 TaxID=1173025 RepID=UPI00029FEE06|nr:serine/threonine-protein kinase [Geitlerinema sp. PCC 7407]AFY67147.1 serine/threonine protein kinase [Geitlerinema sp. PCC 7407]